MSKMLKERILILVVVITALLSCLAIGLTSAKYYSEITGTATIQTASFNVSVDGNPTDFSLSEENATASFDFSVESTSQVAVAYDVVITLPETLSTVGLITFSVNLKNTEEQAKTVNTNISDLVYTIVGAGSFTANGGTNEHTLTVTANDFSNDIDLTDIQIQVVATQVKPTA